LASPQRPDLLALSQKAARARWSPPGPSWAAYSSLPSPCSPGFL